MTAPNTSRERRLHAVVARIGALRREAEVTAERCRNDKHRTEARAIAATLDEAHAWLRGSPSPSPELVLHIAKMVDGAKARLIALGARAL